MFSDITRPDDQKCTDIDYPKTEANFLLNFKVPHLIHRKLYILQINEITVTFKVI